MKNDIKGTLVTGTISITRRGTGFVAHSPDAEDIIIAPENTGVALNGDTVEAEITGLSRPPMRGHRGKQPATPPRPEGRVTRVIERARTEFVGTLTCVQGENAQPASAGSSGVASPASAQGSGVARHCTLTPDNARISNTFIVTDAPEEAQNGMKALVRLSEWTNPQMQPTATFVRLLGEAGTYGTEMEAIVLSQDFDLHHAPDAVAEAQAIAKNERTPSNDEIAARRDMRAIPTFTIDPDDAKDFDDALSVEQLSDGSFEVGIHIADVTHYVRPGTALEREARKRATSIYLTGLTVPMLPEELSNDLCSLKPNEDRLAFSAVFTLTKDGNITKRWFGKTIIHSDKRFTYQTAQDILDAGTGEHIDELKTLYAFSQKMRAQRTKEGAISFETDEVKFELNTEGFPIAVHIKERLETMKMIEDWMLLANKEVAAWLASHVKNKSDIEQTFVFRTHDRPDADRIEELRIFLKALGLSLGKPGERIKAGDINKLFSEVQDTPEKTLVQMATLRSMAKATYTHKNIGHFSLGFEHYTHFTSPIRRYPDMIVHRILHSHLDGTPISGDELAEYRRLAVSSSEREVAAVECERASIRYMHVLYMQKHIGDTFDGIVTGVSDAGMFVEERSTKAEGLLPMRSLDGDFFVADRKKYALVGERTGTTFRMGDIVRIQLVSADTDLRQIEWKLVRE
jgi:ribonuclease R